MKYTYEQVKHILLEKEIELLEGNYTNCKQKLLCKDKYGYYIYVTLNHVVNNGRNANNFYKLHKSNNYSIYNINNFAMLNNLESRCISDCYENSKSKLCFLCKCGNEFYTTAGNFMNFHKIKCDKCTGNNRNLTFEEVYENLKEKGYILDVNKEDFSGVTSTSLRCHDNDGYRYIVTYNAVMRNQKPEKFQSSNIYAIYNINNYLSIHNSKVKCISDTFTNGNQVLEFVCLRCGEHILKKWKNINRNDRTGRHYILCPNCDGRIESIHALVLKQLFKHYYPDTIEEEKSCVNPKTNKIMPTDIVNHRLKIAIEIQSEWHDSENSKFKDAYKKDFWLSKGYKFYDPDIRNYSILEMCQLFFDIEELPSFINYEYSNKLNIKKIQDMLDNYVPILSIAEQLKVNPHRIYDALGVGKLKRPNDYIDAYKRPVVQLDLEGKYIAEYQAIEEASAKTGISCSSIVSSFTRASHYASGFYWFDLNDYNDESVYELKNRFSKFYIPVDKYDKNNNYISSYSTIIDAAKELQVNSYQVWRVIEGQRKSIKGFIFKKSA